MSITNNPFRGAGLQGADLATIPFPSVAADRPIALIARCPDAAVTPLAAVPSLAADLAVGKIWIKDERARMGLGSFKALGAAYVIADHAKSNSDTGFQTALVGRTYVTASAGNHGLSVAAGAKVFGATAVVFIAQTVPEAFAKRLQAQGATVKRAGQNYEQSMAAAATAATENNWTLLSDASWQGYTEIPHLLMEGYLVMASEIVDQMAEHPTHVFLQAGVGGMAAAVAAYLRKIWGDALRIVVVEPDAAPALQASIIAGKPVVAAGPVSNMGRLDCKEPSWIALKGLARDADQFMTISDDLASSALPLLAATGFATTQSGAAGFAALLSASERAELGVTDQSRVLVILSEETSA
jgi:diaminopropionate ammonia-lyase